MSAASPHIIFVSPDGSQRWEVEAPLGVSVMEIAISNNIDMEGACEGNMACSTCHVIVDPDWSGKLPLPQEEEEDMLDLVYDLKRTSRLGCQIIMTAALDGLIVHLPTQSRNLLA
ncbi:MAG: 2Fe-2S iron-sulfur cluster binding domain-containing protein [Alphaproteobacteria bacterium]|nr:2Fe-2S iron-sulfur cluster binding domain-containing protein [Alphaproteobacteria bacterium]MBL6951037.1 2Fe-2S iron-sulfur cluster binding domain-containing protein [Alphaproteobacteria bacterium]